MDLASEEGLFAQVIASPSRPNEVAPEFGLLFDLPRFVGQRVPLENADFGPLVQPDRPFLDKVSYKGKRDYREGALGTSKTWKGDTEPGGVKREGLTEQGVWGGVGVYIFSAAPPSWLSSVPASNFFRSSENASSRNRWWLLNVK